MATKLSSKKISPKDQLELNKGYEHYITCFIDDYKKQHPGRKVPEIQVMRDCSKNWAKTDLPIKWQWVKFAKAAKRKSQSHKE